ncbi:MAG: hypothetical protein HY904_06870 [Deltaproteobacteria bacterium]|nr:hypothetical protein [Deltaproteobacteria bacterium]
MTAGAVGLMLAGLTWAAAPAAERLLVMPLAMRVGVPARAVESLSDFVLAEVRKVPGYAVVSQSDIEQMLTLESRKQMLGCDATSCLAELGGALNAKEVLYGSVGRLGATEIVLSLTRLAPHTGDALAGDAERLSASDTDAMTDGAVRLLHRLYPAYQPPPPRVRPMGAIPLWALMAVSGAGVMYATFSSLIFSTMLMVAPVCGCLPWCASLTALLASPLFSVAVQEAVGDVVGRRQAGTRWASLVACPFLCCGLTVLPIGVGAGAALGGSLAYYYPALGLVGFAGALIGVLPALAIVAGALPAATAAALLLRAETRPPEAEPSRPGLYAPYEHPSARFPGFTPRWLLGGTEDVELAETAPDNASRQASEPPPPPPSPPPSEPAPTAAEPPAAPEPAAAQRAAEAPESKPVSRPARKKGRKKAAP